jgi:hypothetical protein
MPNELLRPPTASVPAIIADAGEQAIEHYRAFFAVFGNPATRRAYQVQAERFLRWAEARELSLTGIRAFDAIFYADELERSHSASTVAVYWSILSRLFRHLKSAGVVADDPFDLSLPAGELPAESPEAVEWQAVVDAAEVTLTVDSLRQYGLIEGGGPINQRLCETILALGKERGISPAAGAWEKFVAALSGGEATPEPDPATAAATAATGKSE